MGLAMLYAPNGKWGTHDPSEGHEGPSGRTLRRAAFVLARCRSLAEEDRQTLNRCSVRPYVRRVSLDLLACPSWGYPPALLVRGVLPGFH
jgi:hypothetical protein